MKAVNLDVIMARMGILGYCRALVTNSAGWSHGYRVAQPVQDNGVKLIDPDGGMLVQDWEAHAKDMANAQTFDQVLEMIKELVFGCCHCEKLSSTGFCGQGYETS